MVQLQLCTLEQLMNSEFGRPSPRHGLQLLFWFANQCVTCEVNFVVIMKLVSDCQPERGFCGFHRFSNIEELLPVLDRSRRQVVYFEVGNLNTESYPAAANLPTYVRENYGLRGNRGNNNIDRIIISCQVRTRVVETVYVTEHDGETFGGFSPDRTYEISYELIQALQSPQLDLTTFLTQVGYYGDIQMPQVNITEEMHYPTARTAQRDYYQFSSEAFSQQLGVNMEPFSYDQQAHCNVNITTHNSQLAANYSEVQHIYRRSSASGRPNTLRSYWLSGWRQLYEGIYGRLKKGNGGSGISFVKLLLSAGVLYLAAKCFSWLKSCWKVDLNENTLRMIPLRTSSYQHAHVMLDYVF